MNIISKELGLLNSSLTSPNTKNHMINSNKEGMNFSEYLQNDIKGFLDRAKEGEKKTLDYINGKEDIEYLVPHIKNLLLEFEEKTRILGAMVGAVKNLLNTHM